MRTQSPCVSRGGSVRHPCVWMPIHPLTRRRVDAGGQHVLGARRGRARALQPAGASPPQHALQCVEFALGPLASCICVAARVSRTHACLPVCLPCLPACLPVPCPALPYLASPRASCVRVGHRGHLLQGARARRGGQSAHRHARAVELPRKVPA